MQILAETIIGKRLKIMTKPLVELSYTEKNGVMLPNIQISNDRENDRILCARQIHFACRATEGDRIRIDIMANTIDVLVSDGKLEERRRNWKPKRTSITSGALSRYAALVTSANRGAVLEIK